MVKHLHVPKDIYDERIPDLYDFLLLAIISLFEADLRRQFPNARTFNYTIDDLNGYLSKFSEIFCLM